MRQRLWLIVLLALIPALLWGGGADLSTDPGAFRKEGGTITGDVAIEGGLVVSGTALLPGLVIASGVPTLASDVVITNATITGNLAVQGNTQLNVLDVTDTTTTRSNLGVYSTGETDAIAATLSLDLTTHALDNSTHSCDTIASLTALEDHMASCAASCASNTVEAGGNALRYYFEEMASDIPTYEAFSTTPVVDVASDTVKTVTGTLSEIDAWATPVGEPDLSILQSGIINVHLDFTKGSGAHLYTMFSLYSRTASGVETFIASSGIYLATTDGANYTIALDIVILAPVVLDPTDRLVIRQLAAKGSGGNTSIQNWYGGTRQGYIAVPISGTNFARTDFSNVANASMSGSLDVENDVTATEFYGSGQFLTGVGGALTVTDEVQTTSTATNTVTTTMTIPVATQTLMVHINGLENPIVRNHANEVQLPSVVPSGTRVSFRKFN